jgi:hypothetical protein
MNERQKRLIEVYEHLRRYFGIHTKTGFAEALHYGRTSLSAAINGDESYLTDKLFKNICEAYPGVFDLNYLLTGDGQLLTIEEEVKSEDIEKAINPTSAPQAIDYTFLIEKAVEKATAYADKTIAMMEKQINRLENDIDAKDQEIKRLQSRIQELETENIILKNEESLGKYPFEMGVSDKKEPQQTHV